MLHLLEYPVIITFFLMLFAHALADYPLQGAFMATHKSRHSPNPFPEERHPWVIILTAHCLIHAGFVLIITGSIWLAIAELILHWIIDYCKNENKVTYQMDQLLHVLCKVVYVLVLIAQ